MNMKKIQKENNKILSKKKDIEHILKKEFENASDGAKSLATKMYEEASEIQRRRLKSNGPEGYIRKAINQINHENNLLNGNSHSQRIQKMHEKESSCPNYLKKIKKNNAKLVAKHSDEKWISMREFKILKENERRLRIKKYEAELAKKTNDDPRKIRKANRKLKELKLKEKIANQTPEERQQYIERCERKHERIKERREKRKKINQQKIALAL